MPTLLNQNRVGYALEDLPIPATRLIPWDAATRPNADFRAHSADSRFLSPFLPLFPLDLLLLIAPLHASLGDMKRRGRSARGVFHPEPRSRSGDYPRLATRHARNPSGLPSQADTFSGCSPVPLVPH